MKGFNTYFGNINPRLAIQMHKTGLTGDFQKNNELWLRMVDLYAYAFAGDMYRATAYGKEMVRLAGHSMGDYTRPPLQPVSEEERKTLRQLMEQAGFFA